MPADDEGPTSRLHARPVAAGAPGGDPAGDRFEPGLHPLGLDAGDRDGMIYIPEADGPRPLLVACHGATMNARQMVRPLLAAADDAGVVLLVPDSRSQTWDVLLGGYGVDVAFIDRALALAFARTRIDGDAVFVGGISDGASYALSLGVANGDLFSKIVAFSPGFIAPLDVIGQPRVFVSHGVHDRILPIDACGRPIVAGLRKGGYDVEYIEFDGGHEMPDPLIRAAFTWLVT